MGHLRLEDAARDDAVEGLLLGRVQQVVLHGAGGRSGTVDELKQCCRMANLIPSLTCIATGWTVQSKERKGSNFAVNRSRTMGLQARRATHTQKIWLCPSGNHSIGFIKWNWIV